MSRESRVASREGTAPWRALACAAGLVAFAVSAASAQQKVPLVLNHLAIVLDSATYNDVRHSPFMVGQFAAADTGLLTGFEGGRGIRLLGKYNFLVLADPSFSATKQVTAQVGDATVVLATSRAGDLSQLSKQGEFGPAGVVTISLDRAPDNPNEYVDGSDRIGPRGADRLSDRFQLSVMEYSPGKARERAKIDSLPESNLAASRFLAPYFDSKKLLSRLTGATLAVPVDDIKKISRVLARDGITVIPEGEGTIIKLDGFTLHLIPSFVGAGVKQLQFALTRTALGNPIYQFGPKSQLRFGPGPIAVWDFKWP